MQEKEIDQNRNGIFCQKFLIFLKSLKSLNKKIYYTLYSLHELSFIEIWTQDGSTSWIIHHRNNILAFKIVFRSTPRCIFQKCIYPKCIFAKCTRLALVLSFASLFHFLQAFLPRLIIQSDCSRVVWCELLSCSGALSPRRPRRQSFYLKAKLII